MGKSKEVVIKTINLGTWVNGYVDPENIAKMISSRVSWHVRDKMAVRIVAEVLGKPPKRNEKGQFVTSGSHTNS